MRWSEFGLASQRGDVTASSLVRWSMREFLERQEREWVLRLSIGRLRLTGAVK
jgi:hypothetical protein